MKTRLPETFLHGLILLLTIANSSHAAEEHHSNRYTLHSLTADPHEIDLLSTIIETKFPPQIATVGSAIDYVLLRSGYRLIRTNSNNNTMQFPLPQVHRTIGPLDIRTAIETIAGDPWELLEDKKQRVVWFQLAGASPDVISKPVTLPQPKRTEPIVMNPSLSHKVQTERNWILTEDRTLRQNFEEWVRLTDWSLEWISRHDYDILHPITYQGTLEEAVEAVLEHYRNAPFSLTATFFAGNSVLLVEPSNVGGN